MLFDAISIYIMKYRAEHACIYELWLIHGCIDRPVAEKLDRWMDRSIFVLYASWYYIDITYSHRLILHIICYTLKQHIACLIQDFVNRYKMPTKSRSTIAGVGRCFFIQKKFPLGQSNVATENPLFIGIILFNIVHSGYD